MFSPTKHAKRWFLPTRPRYIHDLPRYASKKALQPNTAFEKLLTVHLEGLAVPSSFFDLHFSGRFDFSSVKVHLITSRPGLSSGPLAESSGLLRLRKVVSDLEERSEMIKEGVHLEYCAGSIGHLNDKWLKEFYDCAIGRKVVPLAKMDCDIPSVEVVFPTYTDVEECDEMARKVRGASTALEIGQLNLAFVDRSLRRISAVMPFGVICERTFNRYSAITSPRIRASFFT